MTKSLTTKDALLAQARQLFWTRGYSNVSLREIASAAGVDVALVSRYFGSKRGLFEATLAELPVLTLEADLPEADLVDAVVELFATAPRKPDTPSALSMIMMNAADPEVGAQVREAYASCWQSPLEHVLGNQERAALFSAAMLGMGVAEKSLLLPGIADPATPCYAAQLRRFLTAVLEMPVSDTASV